MDVTHFQEQFPELYAAFEKATTRQGVFQIARRVRKQFYAETLPYPCCDGAIEMFKAHFAEKFEVVPSRSAEAARIERMAYIRNSDGRRTARRWH